MTADITRLLPGAAFVPQRVFAKFASQGLVESCQNELRLEIDFIHLLGRRHADGSYQADLSFGGPGSYSWHCATLCEVVPVGEGVDRLKVAIPFIAPDCHGHVQGSVLVHADGAELLTVDLGQLYILPNDVLVEVLEDGAVLRRLKNHSSPFSIEQPESTEHFFTNIYPVIDVLDDDARQGLVDRIIGAAGLALRQLRRDLGVELLLTDWQEQVDSSEPFMHFPVNMFVAALQQYMELAAQREPLDATDPVTMYTTSYQMVSGQNHDRHIDDRSRRLFVFGFKECLTDQQTCAVDLGELLALDDTDAGKQLVRGIVDAEPVWGTRREPPPPPRVDKHEPPPPQVENQKHFVNPDDPFRFFMRSGVFVDSSGRATDQWIDWHMLCQNTPESKYVREEVIAAELARIIEAIEKFLHRPVAIRPSRVGYHNLEGLIRSAGRVPCEARDELSDDQAVICLAIFDTQLIDLVPDLNELADRGAHTLCTMSIFSLNAGVPAEQAPLMNLSLYRLDLSQSSPKWVDMTHPDAGLALLPYLTKSGTS